MSLKQWELVEPTLPTTAICPPGLWVTLNLKGCRARYNQVIRVLPSFMWWRHFFSTVLYLLSLQPAHVHNRAVDPPVPALGLRMSVCRVKGRGKLGVCSLLQQDVMVVVFFSCRRSRWYPKYLPPSIQQHTSSGGVISICTCSAQVLLWIVMSYR